MEHLTTNEFEKQLRNVFVRVTDDQGPISVVTDEGREIILVNGDAYRTMMETCHLLSNPVNAERLRLGIQQHKEGNK